MMNLSFEKLFRLGKRGVKIAEVAQSSPEIAAVSQRLYDANDNFNQSMSELRTVSNTARKEIGLVGKAMAQVRRAYDGVRAAILANGVIEAVGSAASSYTTLEDLLKAAEDAEEVLVMHQEEPWAKSLIPIFLPALELAEKEWSEGIATQTILQKTQAKNRECAAILARALVDFRRVVRVVYGSSSKEYRMLRTTHFHQDGDNEVPSAPLVSDQESTHPALVPVDSNTAPTSTSIVA